MRIFSLVAAVTVGTSMLVLGVAACGDDDSAINAPDASPDTASSSSGSSSGGASSSGGSSSGGSTSSGGSSSGNPSDAGDGGDGSAKTFSIGGTVTGLNGAGLVLQDNAGDDLTVAANGTFVFPKKLATGATYAVTVKTQPSNPSQTCTVSGGTGTVASADITSVVVNCATDRYTIGGTAAGLTGTAVLQNNGGDDLVVSANGTFAFATTLTNGAAYAVTVLTNPPGQTCVVANGSGNVAAANVANITLTCTTNTYAIGGTLTGLGGGKSIQLVNNGGDALTRNADGAFTFATKLATGASYNVTISTQPAGQTCSVVGGTGTVGTGDVESIVVNCADGAWVVGGTVSGLSGELVLDNNGTDDLSVTANGTFAFSKTLATNATYAVTVKTQPTGQTCTVANGTGTVTNANITNVTVTCTTNTYTVGGNITGLKGNVILQNNGKDNLARNADGSFTFTTPVAYGSTYNVTILNQPQGQTCIVTNGSGVMGTANVTDVVVTCEDKHTVGGTIAGLSGSPVVLQNNGGDNLSVTTSGAFTFATPLAEGATYNVTVLTQPANRTCTVQNGTGTVGKANVVTVIITCTP